MSTAASILPRPAQRDPLAVFLFFSVLVHLLLLFFFPIPQQTELAPPAEQITEVELLPPPPPVPPVVAKAEPPAVESPVEKPKAQEEPKPRPPERKPKERLPEQIVNPPDQVNDQIPEKTRLLSDRNSATKEETVAAGVPRPAPRHQEKPLVKDKPDEQKTAVQLAMKPPTAQPLPKPPIEKSAEKALGEPTPAKSLTPGKPEATPRTPQLFARPDDLLTQGWLSDAGSNREKKEERQPPQGRDLIALAPPPAENLFSLPGPIGTPDVLPDIRQGQLTFLNTKAHRFAPFVRRVAIRVFQHLIIHQRKALHINDVVAARDFSTIEAKLDAKGNLKKLVIQTRSGSYAVDQALLTACENGAWDENPPEEAKAEDGYIHFVFRSDIEAQYDDLGLRAILTTLQVGLV